MKTALIVQARMGSTRLPGKVLLPLAGEPMLRRLLERLSRVALADSIVVATTTEAGDDVLEEFCRSEGINYYRGSSSDVLSRYFEAARRFDAELVVRITADCPLIDSSIIDRAIDLIRSSRGEIDYVSNMHPPTYPYGMAVEAFSFSNLAKAHREATQADEREHVTPYFYWNPDKFRLETISMHPDLSHHRWTVDTPQDYELVKRIFERLYPAKPHFAMGDVLELLDQNPDWVLINSDVQQVEPKTDARK